MPVFMDADKIARLIARLVDVTSSACGPENGRLVARYLRRSNKGNIVLGVSPVLTKRFLESRRADSLDDLEAFVACLQPEAAADLVSWAQAVENNQNPAIREFGLSDFYTERFSEDNRAVVINNFLTSHQEYAQELKNVLADFYDKPARIPDSLVNYIECCPNADGVSLTFVKSKLATVRRAECVCGFAATVTLKAATILPSFLKDNHRILGDLARDHIYGQPGDRQVTRVQWLQGKGREITAEYYLAPMALKAAEILSEFAQAVQDRKISYDGKWHVGPFSFKSIMPDMLAEFAEKYYADIEAGRFALKSEARARAEEAWRTQIKPVCEGYGEIFAGLPLSARLTPRVADAYKKLLSLDKTWSAGKISVSKDGLLAIGGKELANIEQDARTEAVRLYNEFTGKAERARERAHFYNQHAVYKIIELVSAHPGRMGATGVSQVLAGSKSQRILYNKLDRLPGYGSLSGVISQTDIAAMVEMMVSDGLLTVGLRRGWHHSMPVLRVPADVAAACKPQAQPDREPAKKDRAVAKPVTIQDAIARRSWDTLAGLAGSGDWAAEVALNVAAVLWPSGKAAKLIRPEKPGTRVEESEG